MDAAQVEPGRMSPYGALPVPRMTPELLSLIKTGKVYSLGIPHFEGLPRPGAMVPFTLTPRLRHGDLDVIAPASAAAETITMPVHTATHIDALCHMGEHQDALGNPQPGGEVRLYAGKGKTVAAKDTVSYQGQLHLSAGDMIPIIQRGILVDVAGYKGMDVLPDAYEITVEDLQATLEWEGVKITPDTAVIFRTGYYKHFREGNPAYLDAIAGPGLPVAQSLVEAGVNLVGADNMTVEALPPLDHRVHRFLLVHNGVTLVENIFLEMLAAEKAYEFLLMIAPLRIYGATGSWVNPIAIT
jgi:kynurenine formamidase